MNVRTRPLIRHKHLPTIRLSDDRVNLEYWQLERPHPSADPSPSSRTNLKVPPHFNS